jgi:hypothetical protein
MLIVSAERGHSQRPKSRTTRFEEHLEAQAMVGERVFSPPVRVQLKERPTGTSVSSGAADGSVSNRHGHRFGGFFVA